MYAETNAALNHLTDYVRKGNPRSRNRIFIGHRLDRDTSGVKHDDNYIQKSAVLN